MHIIRGCKESCHWRQLCKSIVCSRDRGESVRMHGSVHMCQNRLTFLLCSLSNTDDEKTHREGGGG